MPPGHTVLISVSMVCLRTVQTHFERACRVTCSAPERATKTQRRRNENASRLRSRANPQPLHAGLPRFQAIENGACRIKSWACSDAYKLFVKDAAIHAHTVDVCAAQCKKIAGCRGASWQEEHVSGENNCFLCTWPTSQARAPQPCRPEVGSPKVDYLVMAEDCDTVPFASEPLDTCDVNPWPVPEPGTGADYPPGPPGTYPIEDGTYSSGRGSSTAPAVPGAPPAPTWNEPYPSNATPAAATGGAAAGTTGAAAVAPADHSGKSSNTAAVAIACSVVGGVVLVALIAAISICIVVKKRRAANTPPAGKGEQPLYGGAYDARGSQYGGSQYGGPQSHHDSSIPGTWQVRGCATAPVLELGVRACVPSVGQHAACNLPATRAACVLRTQRCCLFAPELPVALDAATLETTD